MFQVFQALGSALTLDLKGEGEGGRLMGLDMGNQTIKKNSYHQYPIKRTAKSRASTPASKTMVAFDMLKTGKYPTGCPIPSL